MSLLEVFGYVASVLIALSLMMSNIKQLRWINLFGAAAFSIYGYFIDAYPVFILNGWIALVDIYYLIRIYQEKDQFDLVRLRSVESPLFNLLKASYGKDIIQLHKGFEWSQLDEAVVFLLFRNMKPVGFFACKQLNDEGKVQVLLDYIIPEDRDFKAASFMFASEDNQLKKEGINHLVAKPYGKDHELYLSRVGFNNKESHFELVL